MRTRAIRRTAAGAAALLLAVSLTACGGGSDDGRVELEFFQFKPEAIEVFDEIIADFEAENPDIDVIQNHVPNADIALRARLVRNDIPDVMTLNAGATWAEFAPAGIFYDFSDEEVTKTINPAILEIINDLGTAGEGEVNGLPFVNNADGVIYNKQLFEQHGVDVPTTWDELIAAAEKFQSAGVLPFYMTLKDSWTSLPSWNALASNLAGPEFWEALKEDEASFTKDFTQTPERLLQLYSFGAEDMFSRDYNTGNQEFAKGASAMYLQGSWAIPVIRSFNPTFDIGTFALPVDAPSETRLVSGVDVAITMGREPAHLEESMQFIEFLMSEDVVASYAEAQSAIPALEGLLPSDTALEGLVPFFEDERLVGFSDHQIPPAIPLPAINQQFLIDKDPAAYLETLDDEWDKVARRRLSVQ